MIKSKDSGDHTCWWGCGERGTILHCWWDCKLIQPLWKLIWQILRKLEISLPEDPAILLLGIYPKDALTCKESTCSTVFIAALFIIARSWRLPRCLSMEEWIQKMWFIYSMKCYAGTKNKNVMNFTGKWMELENIILSEVTRIPTGMHGMYLQIMVY